MNPQWCESQENRIVLQETPQCSGIFGEFLRYFYTGQIRISQSTIMGILTLADKYNVKVRSKQFYYRTLISVYVLHSWCF